MRGIEKYENLKEAIPKLMPVLVEAIQSEFLEIKKIDKECEKFIKTSTQFPEIQKAEYVIFSQHIKKNEHKYEMFVFVDGEGNIVRYITGAEMELYGLVGTCDNLHLSEEYVEQKRFSNDESERH